MAVAGLGLLALGFGGCAQSPQQIAVASHSKEYFPSSIYGAASRRVVEDGQPIPHGGGQYLVGKPYTVAGQTYVPSERRIVQVGNASWYGDAFHGRLTANGEIYDKNGFTAAHPTMPLPSYARVTNLRNNYSMIVRVNDRGPYASNRIMDVSGKVAEALDFKRSGTAKIKMEYVGRASLSGSDDARLYATLRTNGPAPWQGEPTMVAEIPRPAPRAASRTAYASPIDERPRQRIADAEPEMSPRWREQRRELPRRDVGRQEAQERDIPSDRSRRHEDSDSRSNRPVRTARFESPHLPIDALLPPPRPDRSIVARAGASKMDGRHSLPPARPLDLGTIPGADSQIASHHRATGLRMARARDD